MYGVGGLLGGSGGVYGCGGGSGGGGLGGGGEADCPCNATATTAVVIPTTIDTPRQQAIVQMGCPTKPALKSRDDDFLSGTSSPVASGSPSNRRRCRLTSSGSNGVSPMATYRSPEASRRTGMLVASQHRPIWLQLRIGLFAAAIGMGFCVPALHVVTVLCGPFEHH